MYDESSLKKEEGNALFRAGRYEEAVFRYKYAIKFDNSDPSLYSNRAAAYLKLGKLRKALTDANTAVALNPDWEKGYYRQGCVLEAMGEYEDALNAFETAMECNPLNLEVMEKINKLSMLAKDKPDEETAVLAKDKPDEEAAVLAKDKPDEEAAGWLRDEGNSLFKAGKHLQAAVMYSDAIKLDPSNSTFYSNKVAYLWPKIFVNNLRSKAATAHICSICKTKVDYTDNRSAAYFNLGRLKEALIDAKKTITLNPSWEKGYLRKGCVLEAMELYDDALSAFQVALRYNPQSLEVSKKIKNLGVMRKDKQQGDENENTCSNIDIAKHLNLLKSEMFEKYVAEDRGKDMFSFLAEILGTAIKSWHETSKVDPSVHFLLDKEKTQIDKYAPVVDVDEAFESFYSHRSCIQFLKQYAEDSFSHAACLVAPKGSISYPATRKGKGSKKWKHEKSDGFFVQFESPKLQKMWFIPSFYKKGKILCRDPVALDLSAHELIPRLYK